MTTFTVKNVPDDLYARLKDAARVHRRSINSEILSCLERQLGVAPDPYEILAKAQELRESIGGPEVTLDEIRDAKSEGRP